MSVLKRFLPGLLPLALSAVAALQSSCIKDDRDDCDPEPVRHMIFVKIVDVQTGGDITATCGAEEAVLAVFDGEGRFVDSRVFDAVQIAEREPWVVTGVDLGGMRLTAWADVGDEMVVAELPGTAPGQPFVKLPVDGQGYSPSPGDFFFGLHTLRSAVAGFQHIHEVVLSQKNAKVHVTVKGLEAPVADDHYFVIETPGNGYDLFGDPLNERARMRHTGRVTASGDLVSPEPYLAIHSADPDHAGPGDGASVSLYRRSGGGDTLLASATHTDAGEPILLPPGKTTNILIDLGRPACISVRVEVTGWREVYQWDQW